jgi:hypothetical protein
MKLALPLIVLAAIGAGCAPQQAAQSTSAPEVKDASKQDQGQGQTKEESTISGDTITLVLNPKPGATYVYEKTDTAQGMTNTSKNTSKVISNENGVVVMENTVSVPEISEAGITMRLTLDEKYRVKSVTTTSKDPAAQAGAKAAENAMKLLPVFPEKEVKPGDSWKGTFDLAKVFADSGQPATFKGDSVFDVKMTYVGTKEINGRRAAIIKQEASDSVTMVSKGVDIQMSMSISGENYFEIDTGMSLGMKTQTTTKAAGQEIVQNSETKVVEVK